MDNQNFNQPMPESSQMPPIMPEPKPKKKAKILKQAFGLYAKGNATLGDISDFLAQHGILSRGGKRIHKDRITFILKNPFYYGHFRYTGEIHEGKHEPIIRL